ncbi:unnamed protein product [Orchesella dallaii]|uniref:Uncharacterized protein n=1 Tax=Orchesella dallaii TaxID=48710 RepID=A0ABP1R0D9_9HEXA
MKRKCYQEKETGNCTKRLCAEKTDEGDADSYKTFSLYYEGKCLISGTPNSDYCKDDVNAYFNHREYQPICRRQAPEVEVQTGRLISDWVLLKELKAGHPKNLSTHLRALVTLPKELDFHLHILEFPYKHQEILLKAL